MHAPPNPWFADNSTNLMRAGHSSVLTFVRFAKRNGFSKFASQKVRLLSARN